jgi:hypothetical protein
MTSRRVRYRKSTGDLYLEGIGPIRGRRTLYPFYDSLESIGEMSLSSLQKAVADYRRATGSSSFELRWSSHRNDVFDPAVTAPDRAWIESDGERTRVVARESKFSPPTASVLEDLARELVLESLVRHNANLEDLKIEPAPPTASTRVEVRFEIPLRGRTIADAAMVASDVQAALSVALSGSGYESTAIDALESGRPALLIGQQESQWMEAKVSPYYLDEESQKLELAKDVAAFGNSSHSGLILLGLETKRVQRRDVIHRVRLFDLDLVDTHRYLQLLDQYIFPPMEGVQVKVIPVHGNRGVAYIRIPRQPQELRPIFVTGHSHGRRIISHYLTLPTRRDDVVQFRDPAALHSLLVAGRVAMAQIQLEKAKRD